jgi:lactoylglutathione lyase
MKFGYTILYVDDVEATLQFYEKAFGLKQKMLHKGEDGNAYGELDSGATTIAFAARKFIGTHIPLPVQDAGLHNDPPPFELALVSDDVPGAFDNALKEGATAVSSPATKPWGQTVSYVRDNNGFLVEICSPVG